MTIRELIDLLQTAVDRDTPYNQPGVEEHLTLDSEVIVGPTTYDLDGVITGYYAQGGNMFPRALVLKIC